jgi:hypothetical protein
MDSQARTAKLLDRVRQVMRLHHYFLHTERTYVDWIKRGGEVALRQRLAHHGSAAVEGQGRGL